MAFVYWWLTMHMGTTHYLDVLHFYQNLLPPPLSSPSLLSHLDKIPISSLTTPTSLYYTVSMTLSTKRLPPEDTYHGNTARLCDAVATDWLHIALRREWANQWWEHQPFSQIYHVGMFSGGNIIVDSHWHRVHHYCHYHLYHHYYPYLLDYTTTTGYEPPPPLLHYYHLLFPLSVHICTHSAFVNLVHLSYNSKQYMYSFQK